VDFDLRQYSTGSLRGNGVVSSSSGVVGSKSARAIRCIIGCENLVGGKDFTG
jgi:hypothetical protein